MKSMQSTDTHFDSQGPALMHLQGVMQVTASSKAAEYFRRASLAEEEASL